jgi:hypothetical protein
MLKLQQSKKSAEGKTLNLDENLEKKGTTWIKALI